MIFLCFDFILSTHQLVQRTDRQKALRSAERGAFVLAPVAARASETFGLQFTGEFEHQPARSISRSGLEIISCFTANLTATLRPSSYDTVHHVANLRAIGMTPHVTQNQAVTKTGKTRSSAIDERTTRHLGYGMSQSRRAMVECVFGWGKQHGTMRKTKHRGIAGVAADFLLNLIAYNLIRIPKLLAA